MHREIGEQRGRGAGLRAARLGSQALRMAGRAPRLEALRVDQAVDRVRQPLREELRELRPGAGRQQDLARSESLELVAKGGLVL
jgi:hypothetical protein